MRLCPVYVIDRPAEIDPYRRGQWCVSLFFIKMSPTTPTALSEVLSSIPRNHIMAHNHQEWDLMPSSGVSEDKINKISLVMSVAFWIKNWNYVYYFDNAICSSTLVS